MEHTFRFAGFENVEVGLLKWPMSVIRLRSEDTGQLVALGGIILAAWRSYSDAGAFIFAETDGEPHNTITPIARTRNGKFELDLVLRNNITTAEHPLGVYHPHQELHHIKRENIGLIEVMGLAVLPARLKQEIADLESCILAGKDPAADEVLCKHAEWVSEIREHTELTAENIHDVLLEEIGKVFAEVLEDAGVYKCTQQGREAFMRFCNDV